MLTGYRLILYITKTQPLANINLSPQFKIIIQENNYASFFDDSNQPWSIMFDIDTLLAQFATQITLARLNLSILKGNYDNSKAIVQDLKVINEPSQQNTVENGDSVEVVTILTLYKDLKLDEVVENTQSKPFKVKLGKAKIPKSIEESIINMKQGSRRLIVVTANKLQPFYPNLSLNSIIFYDISIQRVRKAQV